jgi:hypothetical protein
MFIVTDEWLEKTLFAVAAEFDDATQYITLRRWQDATR